MAANTKGNRGWIIIILLGVAAVVVGGYWRHTNVQRKAIERVIAADREVGQANNYAPNKVRGMQAIDLTGCPADFEKAYIAHTAAWEEMAIYHERNLSWTAQVAGGFKSLLQGATGQFQSFFNDMAAEDKEFQKALADINDTWMKVKQVAADYGVDAK